MSTLYFNGVALPGDVDVKNWTASTGAGFAVLPFSKEISQYRRQVEALELTNTSAPVCNLSIRTVIDDEVSTEETIEKLVDYGLTYVGQFGDIKIGSTTIATVAGMTGCDKAYDAKKSYGIVWNFVIIKRGSAMRFIEKLRNPSFDAMEYSGGATVIEAWTLSAGSGSIEQVQLFGTEELGEGQFALKMTADSTSQPEVYQDITMATDASSSDYEYSYWKFSADVIFAKNATTQDVTSFVLEVISESVVRATKTFELVSGLPQRLAVQTAVKNAYNSGTDFRVAIRHAGATGDVVYIDNAALEEIEL